VLENIQGCGMFVVSLGTQCLCCCHNMQMFILRLHVLLMKGTRAQHKLVPQLLISSVPCAQRALKATVSS
jgi:hypothetical protein